MADKTDKPQTARAGQKQKTAGQGNNTKKASGLEKLLRYYFGTDDIRALGVIFENMKKASLARSLYESVQEKRKRAQGKRRLEELAQEAGKVQENEQMDLDQAAENPEFLRYVWDRGLSPEEAYLLLNKDNLMRRAAKQAQQKIAASIAAKRERIPEVGAQKAAPSKRKRVSAAALGDEEIDEILSRVQKGEKISF